MKDECNRKIITEFVGLRAKSYGYKIFNEKSEKKKAKGVNRSTLRKIIFNRYKKCLFKYQNLTESQNFIRSKKNEVHTL